MNILGSLDSGEGFGVGELLLDGGIVEELYGVVILKLLKRG